MDNVDFHVCDFSFMFNNLNFCSAGETVLSGNDCTTALGIRKFTNKFTIKWRALLKIGRLLDDYMVSHF